MLELPGVFLTLISLLSVHIEAQCYFPGGDRIALDHQPCESAVGSLCCPEGWTCFDNKLCIVTNTNSLSNLTLGSASRGTCTNPDWNVTACGDFCRDNPVNDNSGALQSCGSQRWCCKPDVARGICDCETGDGTFELEDGIAQTIIGVEGIGSTATYAVPTPSGTTSMPLDSSMSTSTSSETSDSSSFITSASTTSSTLAPFSSTDSSMSSTQPPTPSTSPATANPKPDRPVAIIAGLSVTIGLLILIILIWLTMRKRKRSKRKRQSVYEPQDSNPQLRSVMNVPNVAQPSVPPEPDPYLQPYPSAQLLPPDGVFTANRSPLNSAIIPDNHQEQNRQPDLRHAPAFDPYHTPQPPPGAFQNQERYWSTRPPSYRTNRSPPPQRRTVPRRQQPGITEVLSDSNLRNPN